MTRILLLALWLLVPSEGWAQGAASGEFSRENLRLTLEHIRKHTATMETNLKAAVEAREEAERLTHSLQGRVAEAVNANANLEAELEDHQKKVNTLGRERDQQIDRADKAEKEVERQKTLVAEWRGRFWWLSAICFAAISVLLVLILARQWLLAAFPFLRALKFLT